MVAKKKSGKKKTAKKKGEQDHALPSLALVFGYLAVKDLGSISDQVRVLSRLGYGNQEMATICDTTTNTVAFYKSTAKTTKKKRRGRRS